MSDPAREAPPPSRSSRPHTDHKAEVYRLHMFYLLSAREALRDEGPQYAAAMYGLRDPLLSWLLTASPMQIDKLAHSKHTLFASRIPDGEVGERVLLNMETDEGTLVGRLHGLQFTLTEDDDAEL